MEESPNLARLVDDVSFGRRPVDDLFDPLTHDGCPARVSGDLAARLVELAGRISSPERSVVLRLIWEITVDPRVPATLGTAGLAGDRGPGRPVDRIAEVNAHANREQFRPLVGSLATFLNDERYLDVRAAAAAALSAHVELADRVGDYLTQAYRAAPAAKILLASAVLAGSAGRALAGLADLFLEVLATSPKSPAALAAAIGLRNCSVPGSIPRAAVDGFLSTLNSAPVDLRPWIRHNDPVRTASSLLIDDRAAHAELLQQATRSSDEDARHSAIAEVWRGLCAWRGGEEDAVARLVDRLSDRSPDVVESASGRLVFVPDIGTNAVDPLAALVYESTASTPLTKANAVLALATHGDKRCLGTVLDILAAQRPVRWIGHAIRGMATHASTLIPAIRAALRGSTPCDSPDRAADIVRAVASWPISVEPWPEVLDLLTHTPLRMAVLEMLGTVVPPDGGLAVLVDPFLRASDPSVRVRAAWARWRLTGQTAPSLGVFREMLVGTPTERREAAAWIARLGTDAHLVTPLLIGNRANENRHVAITVNYALVAVGAPEEANPTTLLEGLRSRPHMTDTLRAMGRKPILSQDLDKAVRVIAHSSNRYTWPDVHDTVLEVDTELRRLARFRLDEGEARAYPAGR